MVYGRDVDGEVTTFGTTGYTYKSTFLLYDRATESLWYPLGDDMITAVSGPRRGDRLPYIKESDVTTLGEWRALHPRPWKQSAWTLPLIRKSRPSI